MTKTKDCSRCIVMLKYQQIFLWESYTKGNFSSVERQLLCEYVWMLREFVSPKTKLYSMVLANVQLFRVSP